MMKAGLSLRVCNLVVKNRRKLEIKNPPEVLHWLVLNHCGDLATLYATVSGARNYESSGVSTLYLAANGGYETLARQLLDRDPLIDERSRGQGAIALSAAVAQNHVEVVRLLLDRGADVNVANNDGETPLHCASRLSYTDMVMLLLAEGADVNVANNDGSTPLHPHQAQELLIDAVRLLLDRGADVNVAGNDGQSPYTMHQGKEILML